MTTKVLALLETINDKIVDCVCYEDVVLFQGCDDVLVGVYLMWIGGCGGLELVEEWCPCYGGINEYQKYPEENESVL